MNTVIRSVRSTPNRDYNIDTPGRQVAVFLDRDGVFNKTEGFVNSPEDLEAKIIPGSLEAIARLTQNSDAKVILLTNQGGIDLGHMSEEKNHAIQEKLADLIVKAGGRMDAIYYCPNGKGYETPAGETDGRKPQAGMFIQAGRDFGEAIDLADSYMIGDMTTDILAGEAATDKLTTVLVKTGFGLKSLAEARPDRVEENVSTAIDYILTQIHK